MAMLKALNDPLLCLSYSTSEYTVTLCRVVAEPVYENKATYCRNDFTTLKDAHSRVGCSLIKKQLTSVAVKSCVTSH